MFPDFECFRILNGRISDPHCIEHGVTSDINAPLANSKYFFVCRQVDPAFWIQGNDARCVVGVRYSIHLLQQHDLTVANSRGGNAQWSHYR